jgi:hypothetical protein
MFKERERRESDCERESVYVRKRRGLARKKGFERERVCKIERVRERE